MNDAKKKQLNIIIGSVITLLAVIFVVLNTNPVAINFGFFKVKLPLIIVLVVMVIVGILLGWFLVQGNQFKKKN